MTLHVLWYSMSLRFISPLASEAAASDMPCPLPFCQSHRRPSTASKLDHPRPRPFSIVSRPPGALLHLPSSTKYLADCINHRSNLALSETHGTVTFSLNGWPWL